MIYISNQGSAQVLCQPEEGVTECPGEPGKSSRRLTKASENSSGCNVKCKHVLCMFCLDFYHSDFGVRKTNHCVGEVHQICSLNVHISLYFLISTEKPRLIPDNCRQAGSPDMVGA